MSYFKRRHPRVRDHDRNNSHCTSTGPGIEQGVGRQPSVANVRGICVFINVLPARYKCTLDDFPSYLAFFSFITALILNQTFAFTVLVEQF